MRSEKPGRKLECNSEKSRPVIANTIIQKIMDEVAREKLWVAGSRLALAVSGGADSVFLVHALREIAPHWNLTLSLAHVNHQLRGSESDEDQNFVADLARQFQLPLFIHHGPPTPGVNLEQAARRIRLDFFRSLIPLHTDCVATAHTRSDQAETVLYRFMRGSGTAGLAGILPKNGLIPGTGQGIAPIVRPLLAISRGEILDFLTARKIAWRDDSTNQDLGFARNRIRHDLLPRLAAAANSALESTLAQTAAWARGEEQYWRDLLPGLAAEYLTQEPSNHGITITLRCGTLAGLPVAIQRRLMRHAIQIVKRDLKTVDFGHVERILQLIQKPSGSGCLAIPGVRITRSFDHLRIAPASSGWATKPFLYALDVPGSVVLPGSASRLSLHFATDECGYNEKADRLDADLLVGPLAVRNWCFGDRYRPVGGKAQSKIKDLFQKAGVPAWERDGWPVITLGDGSIAWTRQFGAAAEVAANVDSKIIVEVCESEK